MAYYRGSATVLLFLFLSFGPLDADVQAQTLRVEGRVVDASTNASLSFTNVAISGTSRGTATNENGRFVLSVDSLPIRLAVSHIGYTTVERTVTKKTARSVVIRLEPKPVAMEEMVIKGHTAAFFVQKAMEHVHQLEATKTKFTEGVRGFYRQKTRYFSQTARDNKNFDTNSDTVYTEYMESFYNSFTSPFGIRGWSIEQARYARAESPTYRLYFTNFSTLTSKWLQIPPYNPLEEAKVIQPLHPNRQNNFSFEIIGHVTKKGRDLIKIKYKPKENLDKLALSGFLFIDAETYALHRYEGTVQSSDSFLFEVGGEMEDVTFRMSVSLRQLDDPSVTVVDQVRFTLSYDHVVADIRRRYKTTSTFFVYDDDPEETFGTSKIKNDYAAIDSVDYDPEFWRNNPVLARTPVDEAVIRSFEETGGFGRFVKEQIPPE